MTIGPPSARAGHLGRALALLALPVLAGACAETPLPPPVPAHRAAPAAEEPAADDPEYASLDILCEPPGDVLLDGKPAGATPLTVKKVVPGSHDVTCVDPEGGNRTVQVKLEAGESRTVNSNRIPGIIEQRPATAPGKK